MRDGLGAAGARGGPGPGPGPGVLQEQEQVSASVDGPGGRHLEASSPVGPAVAQFTSPGPEC